jgi:hypothetical protein
VTDRLAPEQVIDLTVTGDSLRYVEVLTPAGLVRVNVNLVNVRSRQAVVVVEVEPNTSYQRKTVPGGNWAAVADHKGSRVDVTLTREPGVSPGG